MGERARVFELRKSGPSAAAGQTSGHLESPTPVPTLMCFPVYTRCLSSVRTTPLGRGRHSRKWVPRAVTVFGRSASRNCASFFALPRHSTVKRTSVSANVRRHRNDLHGFCLVPRPAGDVENERSDSRNIPSLRTRITSDFVVASARQTLAVSVPYGPVQYAIDE